MLLTSNRGIVSRCIYVGDKVNAIVSTSMNKAARTHYPFLRNVLEKRAPLYSRKRINVA